MKNLLIIALLLLFISSCTSTQPQEEKPYSIHWRDNSILVVMQHPTMSIVTPGLSDWRGVDLEKVIDEIYEVCSSSQSSGDVVVFVGFENPQTDKYGNVTMAYEHFEIATIPLSEARKYKSGKFLDAEYQIKQGFHNAAFGQIQTYWNYRATLPDGSKVYFKPTEIKYIVPIDTLDF